MTAVIGPLNTVEPEVEPVFNVDRNNDGSTDDEKTQHALSVIGQSHDLLFVHYKDIDATGHDWGDLHQTPWTPSARPTNTSASWWNGGAGADLPITACMKLRPAATTATWWPSMFTPHWCSIPATEIKSPIIGNCQPGASAGLAVLQRLKLLWRSILWGRTSRLFSRIETNTLR